MPTTINEATQFLKLYLDLSYGGHCCLFLRFLVAGGNIRAYSVDSSSWELKETHREQTASASSGFSRIEGAGLHGCKAP